MKHICLFLALYPLCLFADGLPNQPYIYVEGKAQVEKPADMVTLRFDVYGHNADRAKANEEVQAKAIKVLALLKERKIGETDVVAEDLTSEPEFEKDEPLASSRGKVIAYFATRPFAVKVRDVTVFPKLADDLIAMGGLEFAHIEGGLIKQKEIAEELWQKALVNARERAEKTLGAMNMKIDAVFGVSPVGFTEIERKMFESGERVIVTGSNVPTSKERAQPSEYRLALVSLTQSVNVIYLISPAK